MTTTCCTASKDGYVCERRAGHTGAHNALMGLYPRTVYWRSDAKTCGGCQGVGAHRRWCRAVVGLSASIYGPMSEQLGSMGDTVGPNNKDLANRLWALSGDMREWAKSQVTPVGRRERSDD